MNLIFLGDLSFLPSFESKREINTEPFRRAIRYYTENIYGYYHEHYDYAQVIPLRITHFKLRT